MVVIFRNKMKKNCIEKLLEFKMTSRYTSPSVEALEVTYLEQIVKV